MDTPPIRSGSPAAPAAPTTGPGSTDPPQGPKPPSAPSPSDQLGGPTSVRPSGAPTEPAAAIAPIESPRVTPEMRREAWNRTPTVTVGGQAGTQAVPDWLRAAATPKYETLSAAPGNKGFLIAPPTVPMQGPTQVESREGRYIALQALAQAGVNVDGLKGAVARGNDPAAHAQIDTFLADHISAVKLTGADGYEPTLTDPGPFFSSGAIVRSRGPTMRSESGAGQIPDAAHEVIDPRKPPPNTPRIPIGSMMAFRNDGHTLADEPNYNVWQLANIEFVPKK